MKFPRYGKHVLNYQPDLDWIEKNVWKLMSDWTYVCLPVWTNYFDGFHPEVSILIKNDNELGFHMHPNGLGWWTSKLSIYRNHKKPVDGRIWFTIVYTVYTYTCINDIFLTYEMTLLVPLGTWEHVPRDRLGTLLKNSEDGAHWNASIHVALVGRTWRKRRFQKDNWFNWLVVFRLPLWKI